MSKKCNHECVGMMVWRNDKLLLIERKRGAKGFAPPAGHVDEDANFEDAAKRELMEEVGLSVKNLKLIIEGRKENKCRREEGDWHYWKIYKVDADGEITANQEEAKQAGWYSVEQLKILAEKTKRYLEKGIAEDLWEQAPGIEPVWYEWFKQLKII
jgi:ADP-ribose pyrophosphatase YjhB (NUDIX family)